MNRTRLILLGASVAFLALLAFGVIRLSRSYAAATEAREARDTAFANLQNLYTANPFPSVENAERMRRDVAALERMRAALTNAVSALDVARPDLSPSRFMQELQTAVRDRLQARAPIVEGTRAVAPGFAFGFERYLAAGAPIPRQEHVPRLAQQLAIVEKLVDEVYAAQIGTLRALTRDTFDAASADDAGEADDARGSRRRSRRDGADEGSAAGGAGLIRTPYYSAQRFTLEVTGRQHAICDLLNRLAAMKLFVIVTDIDLRKRGDDLRAPAAATTPAAAAPATAPGVTQAEQAPVSSLPPNQRLVAGVEIDPPIDARIELEVCDFAKKEGV